MIRGASHPLGMILPGAQLTGATGFALLRFGVECSVVLSSRSTPGKR